MNKRKLLICCSLITVLLAAFSFPIYADETTPVDTGDSAPSIPYLDSYFYDNYDLLPYIESSGEQYIDTGIIATNNLDISIKFSDLYTESAGNKALFGSYASSGSLALVYFKSNGNNIFYFYNTNKYVQFNLNPYTINSFELKNNTIYANGSNIFTFDDNEFSYNNIYIFGSRNGNSPAWLSQYKLYSFSIYDRSSNDGEGAYVRYYYPAKAKASGTIGLYDAVSKTFVTTLGSVPFQSPIDDNVLNFQISDFLTSGLGWIGQIFDFVIEEPLILMFMAIGLAGVMFRWGRRLVHF